VSNFCVCLCVCALCAVIGCVCVVGVSAGGCHPKPRQPTGNHTTHHTGDTELVGPKTNVCCFAWSSLSPPVVCLTCMCLMRNIGLPPRLLCCTNLCCVLCVLGEW
jgi:hypothetical protein